MTDAEKIANVRAYFERLTAGDTESIVAMFEADGFIVSPFLGTCPAGEFFQTLDAASASSKLTVFDVLLGEAGNSAAAHFEYDWQLANGDQLVFQGIDYFRFGPTGRFASMSIFYDTHPVREEVGDKYQR